MKRAFFFLLFLLVSFLAKAQQADSIFAPKDSIKIQPGVATPILQKLLTENKFLNLREVAVSQQEIPARHRGENSLFYFLLGIFFIISVVRIFFKKYLANLFRVFFNTSLKQSQITDQLQQQELPSLITNFIFILTAGCFAYLLFMKKSFFVTEINFRTLLSIIALVACVYLVKFIVLKFTGWLTGYKTQADLYIFIVFLVNKILGLFLVPVILIAAFADPFLSNAFLTIGLIVIILLLISRFVRSFSLLKAQIKVSAFHFFLYIFSVELLPLALLYKAMNVFLINILQN